MKDLKTHKRILIKDEVWPLCWSYKDVFYYNRKYKAALNWNKVTCKNCLKLR